MKASYKKIVSLDVIKKETFFPAYVKYLKEYVT